MGIPWCCISISSRLIYGARGCRARVEPRGPPALLQEAASWEGSGLRAPSRGGLLCAHFQLNGCCSSLKLK